MSNPTKTLNLDQLLTYWATRVGCRESDLEKIRSTYESGIHKIPVEQEEPDFTEIVRRIRYLSLFDVVRVFRNGLSLDMSSIMVEFVEKKLTLRTTLAARLVVPPDCGTM